jgi:putative transposase
MPRLNRVAPVGVPQHVIQRGNNRQVCFAGEGDMAAYMAWLKEYADKFEVDVHAWVLMTNHVHLLCTPQKEFAVSKMMQSLGRSDVRYFNYSYGRSGTLWEGRFKSCLIESESYLLEVYRYIELNPIRAGMVDQPSDYSWSSYQCNALGKVSALRTEHSLYLKLGNSDLERRKRYRSLFEVHLSGILITELRRATNSGLAFGGENFISQIETLCGKRVTPRRAGRPKLKPKHSPHMG